MNLYLIRHGETEGNVKRLYYGSTDLPLCERGRELLEHLRGQGIYPAAKKVFVSNLKRTHETARLLFGANTILEECPLLREMDFGAFEMRSYEDLKFRADYQHWLSGIQYHPTPGGESIDAFLYRIREGFEQLLKKCESQNLEEAIGVFHGGVIASIMENCFPGEQNFFQWLPDCGRGYVIIFDRDMYPVKWQKLSDCVLGEFMV